MKKTEHTNKPHKVGYGPIAAVLVTLGAFFASQFVLVLILSLVPQFTDWSATDINVWLDSSNVAKFLTILLIEALLVWMLWSFLRRRKTSLGAIGLIKPRITDIGYALGGYAVYFVFYIVLLAFVQRYVPGLNLDQEQELMFERSVGGAELWLVFATLVILPPLAEEFTMRGFLYTGLRSKLNFLPTVIIISLLFGAAHLQLGSGNAPLWVAAIDTFLLSVVLVTMRERSGSLWPPIFLHFIKNGLAFSLLFIFKLV